MSMVSILMLHDFDLTEMTHYKSTQSLYNSNTDNECENNTVSKSVNPSL